MHLLTLLDEGGHAIATRAVARRSPVVRVLRGGLPVAPPRHSVSRGELRAGLGAAAWEAERRRRPQGPLPVQIVAPDPTRPVLVRCPACSRAILFGRLQAGWISVACRHCRIVVRVDGGDAFD
jgi:hypothetical protein